MKPSDLSEFFSLLGKAKKEKEEEFDNLLKEADINLDDLTSSLVSGIKEVKEDQKKQKKNEEKLIEQLDSIIDVIENPKEVKDITEPAVTVGVPEDFDVTTLEDADDNETVEIIDIIKPEPIKTPEISDTVAQAIKFIEETNIKEEIENSDDTNLDKLKTEIKQVRDILYKVLAHGPGSGEVRVLRMDDVDITDLGDEKVLSYDASSEKLKFVEQSGGSGVSTENVRTGILDVAGIATFRNDTLVGTGITLSPDGEEGAFTVVDDDGEEMLYLFEEKDDATRFAIQLEATEEDDVSVDVVEVDDEMIIKVCEFNETNYSIITKNDIVTPPNYF